MCRDILDTGRWTPAQPMPVPPTGGTQNRGAGNHSTENHSAGKCGATEPGAEAETGSTCPKPGAGAGTGHTITDPQPATAATPEADADTPDGRPDSSDAAERSDTSTATHIDEPARATGPTDDTAAADVTVHDDVTVPADVTVHDPADASDSTGPAEASGPTRPSRPTDTAEPANDTEPAYTAGPADSSETAGPVGPRPPVVLPDRGSRRPHIMVTVPAATLNGGNQPGYLAGHGPITAGQARVIAADGDLTRLICDPTTGALLDYGRTRYRPPDILRDFVHTRDRTCVTPGCRAPAARTDIDHVTPYQPGQSVGGPTDVDNLASLCRHHHRAKDGGGSRLRHHPHTGHWTWTTPGTHLHPTCCLAVGTRRPRRRTRTTENSQEIPHPAEPRTHPARRADAAGRTNAASRTADDGRTAADADGYRPGSPHPGNSPGQNPAPVLNGVDRLISGDYPDLTPRSDAASTRLME